MNGSAALTSTGGTAGRSAPTRPRRAAPVDRRDARVGLLVVAAVVSEGKVLLIREEDEPYRGEWLFPGGYPRPGETLTDAAVREVAEEVGLDVTIDGLLGVVEDLAPEEEKDPARWVIVAYLARPLSAGAPRATPEAIDHAWVDPAAPRDASPAFVRSLLGAVSARIGARRPGHLR